MFGKVKIINYVKHSHNYERYERWEDEQLEENREEQTRLEENNLSMGLRDLLSYWDRRVWASSHSGGKKPSMGISQL